MSNSISLNTYFYLKTDIDTLINNQKATIINELYNALVNDINGD